MPSPRVLPRSVAVLVTCLALTGAGSLGAHALAAAPGQDRASAPALRDPNAKLPNALVKAVNAGDRQRARELATSGVVRQMFQVHRADGTFSRVRCEVIGPLRAAAPARVRTLRCVSKIDYHDAGRHAAILSYKDKEPLTVSRIEFADGVRTR